MTIYVKAEQSVCLNVPKVLIKDVAKVYCSSPDVKNTIEKTELYVFPKKVNGKEVFSIMKVVELIEKQFKDLDIENMGETDFIVYYKPPKKENTWLLNIKIVCVCLITFCGSFFSIMTYNNDVGVEDVFYMLHRLILGQEPSGPSIVQLMYSIGLTIGVIIFFNHAANKKLTDDPTPFQVQMRLYEKDVNDTFIIGADRKEETIDVD